jgi:hypothetical protein
MLRALQVHTLRAAGSDVLRARMSQAAVDSGQLTDQPLSFHSGFTNQRWHVRPA